MEQKHSRGPVAYFLDIVDDMIFDIFEEDARNAFNAVSVLANKEELAKTQCVTIDQVESAVAKFGWKLRDYFQ